MIQRTIVDLRTSLFITLGICAIFTLATGEASAQSVAGTSFTFSMPQNYSGQIPAVHFVRLYMTAESSTPVEVYVGSSRVGRVTATPAAIATFDLNAADAEVFQIDIPTIPPDSLYRNGAIRVIAEKPITLYALNATSVSGEGMLILPVTALGDDYVVATGPDRGGFGGADIPSQFMITAPFDDTEVTITFAGASRNDEEGSTITFTMESGDVYSAMSARIGSGLSGARITADRPIAVTAGNTCSQLPDENSQPCDHLAEMLLPIASWGTKYYALPISNKVKGDTYRIYAGEEDADVSVNGTPLAGLATVGGLVDLGYVEFREDTRRSLVISSDRMIAVYQFANSSRYDNSNSFDPFYVFLPPIESFRSQLTFATPGADYPINIAAIVGDSTAVAGAEYRLNRTGEWKSISELPNAEATFPDTIDGMIVLGRTVSLQPGLYEVRGGSGRPLGITIYGGSQSVSYAYPVTAPTYDIPSTTDQIPPQITWQVDCNGLVIGEVTDLPSIGAIRSNLQSVDIGLAGSVNFTGSPVSITPGSDSSASFTLTASDRNAEGMAIITATDAAGNVAVDTVRYIPAVVGIVAESTSISFGSVVERNLVTRKVWIYNPTSATVTIDRVLLDRSPTEFSFNTSYPRTIEPGDTVGFEIYYRSNVEGTHHDTLRIAVQCGDTLAIPLVGTSTDVSMSVEEENGLNGRLDLSIIPNPVTGEQILLDFTAPAGRERSIRMYTAEGREVRTIILPSTGETGRTSIDVDQLPPGRYFMRLRSGDREISRDCTIVR